MLGSCSCPTSPGPPSPSTCPGRGRHPAPLESVTFADCTQAVAPRTSTPRASTKSFSSVTRSPAARCRPSSGSSATACSHECSSRARCPPTAPRASTHSTPRSRRGPAAPIRVMPVSREAMDAAIGEDRARRRPRRRAVRVVRRAPGARGAQAHAGHRRPVAVPRTRRRCTHVVRTLHDIIVPPEKQDRFAANVGNCTMVDVDFGHMCMVGSPPKPPRSSPGSPPLRRRLRGCCARRASAPSPKR